MIALAVVGRGEVGPVTTVAAFEWFPFYVDAWLRRLMRSERWLSGRGERELEVLVRPIAAIERARLLFEQHAAAIG